MSVPVDWKARAEREAAAILDEQGVYVTAPASRNTLVSLLGIAWLQGMNYGSHAILTDAERAFERMRDDL